MKNKRVLATGRWRNYTEAERALALIGVLAGIPLDEINNTLYKGQRKLGSEPRPLNPISHGMLKTVYLPVLLSPDAIEQIDFKKLWEHCLSPKSVMQLIATKKDKV